MGTCECCGAEMVNKEKCHDAREYCDIECDLYSNIKNGYFNWVEWQLENCKGFIPKFTQK